MKSLSDLKKALTIFLKYGDSKDIGAQSEIIYLGHSPDIVSEEDKRALAELGVHEESEFDCFYMFVN